MLSPEYLQEITDGAEKIAEELHREIVSQIVKRIVIRLSRGDGYILTAQDKWQLEVLQEAGFLAENIQKEIAQKTRLQLKELKEAFEDAGIQSMAYDSAVYRAAGLSPAPLQQSPNLIRLVQQAYEATAKEWRNYTRTTANAAQQLFIRECDKAYLLVSSGAMSISQTVKQAVETVAGDGVTVTYPSGHTDTIETAMLRAVRTGISQACAEITDARMDEMDWDIVLTSAHLGARVTDKDDFTNHYWWQGKFYSRSGKDKRFPPFSVCGRGDVQGLCGENCRHSYGPGDGENNPYENFDSDENRKACELSQRQRTLERRIRKTKREVQGLQTALDNASDEAKPELKDAYQKKAALLKKQNAAYNDFCEENGLKRQSDRVSIAQWNRSQAAKAKAQAEPVKDSNGQNYNDVTEEWYANATPNSHDVRDLQEWTVDGVTYRIQEGSRNVVLDYSPHEKEIAQLLENEFGGEIYMVPRINYPPGISTPDYLFRGDPYDLKSIEGKGKEVLYGAISKKKRQSPNFIFEISHSPLSVSEIKKQAARLYTSKHMRFVDKIVIVKGKQICAVYKRAKRKS